MTHTPKLLFVSEKKNAAVSPFFLQIFLYLFFFFFGMLALVQVPSSIHAVAYERAVTRLKQSIGIRKMSSD